MAEVQGGTHTSPHHRGQDNKIPLAFTSAEVVCDSLVKEWVTRYGVPGTITTDKGSQFTSSSWKCMCKAIGAKHFTMTVYHPQSNGMVERFHRQLKDALCARTCGAD